MSKQTFPWQDYLAPKFWPSWLGLGIMRIFAILPYRLQLFIGKAIGHLFYLVGPAYRRQIAQTNIHLCFPELSAEEQEQLVRKHFHSLGISLIETAINWWGSDKKLRKLVKIKGFEFIDQALQQGKGAIVLGAHYTTVDISGRLITLDHKFAVSFHKFKNPLFNQLTLNSRKKIFDRVFDRHEIRPTFRYIKQNNLMWIASDQDANVENSVFAPFFGHLASTQTVPSRMAKITGAPVIPYISRRLDNAQGYEIEFYPPLENFPGNSLEEDATRTNKILEELIKKAPEQYLWVHRRFKTRPEGMPQLYPDKHKKTK
ncbi:MAG: LpxL/LpxP family Kdo(2)-lipid IV(A) lauroyl/palmitoleoyl acyltransferase [Pseudomonadota bacterium]